MKVFEIVEAPGDNWTGRTAGGIIVPGGSDLDARMTPANRTPSNSTPARSMPDPEIKNLRVNVRGPEPEVSFQIGNKRYSGTVEKVLEDLDANGHAGAKQALQNKTALAAQKFAQYRRALSRAQWFGRLISVLGLGAGLWDIWSKYSEREAALESFFKEVVYKGGSFDGDNESYQRMKSPIKKEAVVNTAAFVTAEILQLWTTGKIVKLMRWIKAAQAGLASTGVGVLLAALSYAITEGAQWVVKWAIEKYGPDMVEQMVYDAINTVSTSTDAIPDLNLQTTANLERAAEEVRARARQDRAEQANRALQTLGQSNPALTAPGQTDDDFRRSLERFKGSN